MFGIKYNWYRCFLDAIKDLKSIIISIFFTAYVITFINSERTRKRTLKIQYAFLYGFNNKSNALLEVTQIVFGFKSEVTFELFETNSGLDDLINEQIDQCDINISNEFWNENVTYYDFIYKRKDLLNFATYDVFSTIQFNIIENVNILWELNKETYWFFEGFQRDFWPFPNYQWDKVDSSNIKIQLSNLLNLLVQIDSRLGEPWRKDIKIDKLNLQLYEKQQKYINKEKDIKKITEIFTYSQ